MLRVFARSQHLSSFNLSSSVLRLPVRSTFTSSHRTLYKNKDVYISTSSLTTWSCNSRRTFSREQGTGQQHKGGQQEVPPGGEQQQQQQQQQSKRRNPWQYYCYLLETYPLITKVLTTTFLVCGGDAVAQLYIEHASALDPQRSRKMAMLGGLIVAPTLHYWYNFLNRTFTSPTTSGALMRLACDQGLFAPLFIVVIFTFMLGMDGRWNDLPDHLRANFVDATLTNWALWIPSMFVVFRFVPPNFQVLVVNGVALIWNTYLSYVGHKRQVTNEVPH